RNRRARVVSAVEERQGEQRSLVGERHRVRLQDDADRTDRRPGTLPRDAAAFAIAQPQRKRVAVGEQGAGDRDVRRAGIVSGEEGDPLVVHQHFHRLDRAGERDADRRARQLLVGAGREGKVQRGYAGIALRTRRTELHESLRPNRSGAEQCGGGGREPHACPRAGTGRREGSARGGGRIDSASARPTPAAPWRAMDSNVSRGRSRRWPSAQPSQASAREKMARTRCASCSRESDVKRTRTERPPASSTSAGSGCSASKQKRESQTCSRWDMGTGARKVTLAPSRPRSRVSAAAVVPSAKRSIAGS